MFDIITHSPLETEKGGEIFAHWISRGDTVAMFGGMGMGKTTFIRGIARAFGVAQGVSSPTFAIVNEYDGNIPIYHFDMYRVQSWEDLQSTGFFEYDNGTGILLVEWSENIENALPENAIYVTFSLGETEGQRIISVRRPSLD